MDILWNYVSSPGAIIGFIMLGMGVWSTGKLDSMVFMTAMFVAGLGLFAILVQKLENSEWRRELRRQCEEQHKAMGVSHDDKMTMSYNMGMPMPPPPIVPDNKPAGK